MPLPLRSFLAVIVGCMAAFVHIALIEVVGHFLYPPPPGLDLAKPETIEAYMKVIPVGALVSVLIAWSVGTFAGAWVAARLAPGLSRSKRIHGMVVGGIFLAATLANLMTIPHPTWFWWASLPTFPVAALLGALLATRKLEPEPVLVGPMAE